MSYQTRINLLQAEVDENDQSFFRLLVDGHNIGPRFLGHLTEDARVTGLHAGPQDLGPC